MKQSFGEKQSGFEIGIELCNTLAVSVPFDPLMRHVKYLGRHKEIDRLVQLPIT